PTPLLRDELIGMTSPWLPGGRGRSSPGELRFGQLTGGPQSVSRESRFAIQMSRLVESARSVANHNVSPSADMAGLVSLLVVLMASRPCEGPNGTSLEALLDTQISLLEVK